LLPSPDCYSDSIEPSGTRANLADVDERYRAWLNEKTAHLKVPGLPLSEELSIETNWIPLRAKLREDSNESFDAEFVAELYRLSVVTGTPGTGKSTLMNRLAHRLSASGKRVLLVRLPEVQKLWRKQAERFEDAIIKASADNSGLNEEELRLALSAPDYLLADGLDECNHDRANIAKELDSWVKAPSRRSITKVVVTTRIGHEPGLLPGWKHTEICPLDRSSDGSSIQKYAQQLLTASLGEETEVEKRLALLENQLQTNKTASLAAQNPLLLGFLVQLIAEDKSIRQNRAELYRDIIKLAYKRPLLDREPIELKERDAQRILEIAGWKLLQEPELSADELIESLIE
jgi:predicted NACHT family NTPase